MKFHPAQAYISRKTTFANYYDKDKVQIIAASRSRADQYRRRPGLSLIYSIQQYDSMRSLPRGYLVIIDDAESNEYILEVYRVLREKGLQYMIFASLSGIVQQDDLVLHLYNQKHDFRYVSALTDNPSPHIDLIKTKMWEYCAEGQFRAQWETTPVSDSDIIKGNQLSSPSERFYVRTRRKK
jgi:hypothetical protein